MKGCRSELGAGTGVNRRSRRYFAFNAIFKVQVARTGVSSLVRMHGVQTEGNLSFKIVSKNRLGRFKTHFSRFSSSFCKKPIINKVTQKGTVYWSVPKPPIPSLPYTNSKSSQPLTIQPTTVRCQPPLIHLPPTPPPTASFHLRSGRVGLLEEALSR